MHFNPVKVLLMYFAILFKIHSAHCEIFIELAKKIKEIQFHSHDTFGNTGVGGGLCNPSYWDGGI